MFKNEADFEKTVGRLKIDDKPTPVHRESLRREMLSAFDEAAQHADRQTTLLGAFSRTNIRSPATKLAAAAVVVVGIVTIAHHFTGSFGGSSVAAGRVIEDVNQVIENMNKMPWVVMRTKERQVVIIEEWFCFERDYWIADIPGGDVVSYNYAEGKKYDYDRRSGALTIDSLKGQDSYALMSSPRGILDRLFERVIDKATKPKTKIVREIGRYKGIDVEILKMAYSSYGRRHRTNLYIDTKRRVLVKTTGGDVTDPGGEEEFIYEEEFDYPETGPADIYALGIPSTASVIDKTVAVIAKETAPPGLAPLNIELPRPMFVGTPQDTKVPNLEKPLGHARPPFLAPVGTTNVALGKPVSSSDEEPIIGEIDYITDGDKEAADGSYVELGPMLQHVTIDLEAEQNIYAIVVWHYHKQARVYFDTVVQVASDPDFITSVRTVFNNDIDNSAGFGIGPDLHYSETNEGKLIDTKGAKGRYVRLYSAGNTSNDLNHYIEVEVYGIPVQ